MDFEKFKSTQFERRTTFVEVPTLSAFAGEGEKVCRVEIQGLVGEEVATARERVKENAALETIIEKFAGESIPEIVEAAKEKLGFTDSVKRDAVYRLAVLEFGLVGCPLDRPECVKLFAVNPEAFYLITDKILEITGLGQVPLGE